jgi:hypothetical protein
VFVDPLNAVMLVEDFNDEAEARKQLQPWKRIADEFGCAVVLSAHPPKDRSRKGAALWRGSFARAEIVDIAFSLEGNFQSDTLTLELVKDRTGCAISKLTLRKVGGFEVVEGADEDAASRFVLNFVHKAHEAGKPEVVRAEIVAAAKEAGWSEKTINNRLTALVQTGKLERPRRGFYRLPSQPDTPTPNDPSPQVPDFPTPNPLELRENEIPFFPEFPQGKKGIKGNREEPTPFNFPQFPQVREGKKGNSGNSENSGILPADEPPPEPSEPTYASLRDDELVDAETFIVELDATEPTPENSPIVCHCDEKVSILPSPCCGEPMKPDEEGIGVCVGCGRRWQWTEVSWRSTDPSKGDAPPVEDREDNLSARKGDPPEGDPPTDPADPPTQPDQPDADFVDAEAWIDQWASDAPKVVDIETGEAISLTPTREPPRRLPDAIACRCGAALRTIGRSYACPRCRQPLPTTCRRCGRVLRVVSEGRAECVGCGLLHTFDRSRRLWLADDDPI